MSWFDVTLPVDEVPLINDNVMDISSAVVMSFGNLFVSDLTFLGQSLPASALILSSSTFTSFVLSGSGASIGF
jgi:hypothetical protein